MVGETLSEWTVHKPPLSSFTSVEEEEAYDKLEAALSPKQKKVVNFMVGQVMKKAGKNADPKIVRMLVVFKLSDVTYEEEENGSEP